MKYYIKPCMEFSFYGETFMKLLSDSILITTTINSSVMCTRRKERRIKVRIEQK